MKTKKVPKRTCVVTRESFEKKELLRVVRTPEGNIVIDETGKVNGRGAYLKRDKDVVLMAKKKKVLNRIFETEISDEIYDEIIEKI